MIRKYRESDYQALKEIWLTLGWSISTSDTKEEIQKLVEKNPEISLVYEIEGKVIGGVFGGYDGRRGLVHKLCINPKHQGKGYGKALMMALELIMKELGVVKMSFWVKKDNLNVVEFYEKYGFEKRNDIVTMSKTLK